MSWFLLLGSGLYLGIGLAFWLWSLRAEGARNDAIEIGGGLLFVVGWLPALLILLCVPTRKWRDLDAAAQDVTARARWWRQP